MVDYDDIVKESDIPKSILKNPYRSIVSWSDNRLKNMGSRVFYYLALSPISLIIPDIPTSGANIISNINVLLLTSSGGGKSTIVNTFKEITYNPFDVLSITSAGLENELRGRDNTSLIIGDSARIFKDKILVKALEGVLSEREISRITAMKKSKYKINAIACFAGTPQDLSSYLASGLLFRVAPVIIMHSHKEQTTIGKEIVESIGKSQSKDINIKDIKNYYTFLKDIQEGNNKDHEPIQGYIFEDSHRKDIHSQWDKLRNELIEGTDIERVTYWFRELHNTFKYLCASAVINRINRKIEKGFIRPNEEDLQVALYLTDKEMRNKVHILNCDKVSKAYNDDKQLQKNISSLNSSTRELIEILHKNHKGV